MGQQIPFETIDTVVNGLRSEARRSERDVQTKVPQDRVVTLTAGDDRLHGVALKLDEGKREVHVFEGYWAPLVEGQVYLRDVLRFLIRAAFNGLRNTRRRFKRWQFGTYQKNLPYGRHVLLALAAAMLVVLSLVVMNGAVVLKALALSPIGKPDVWALNGVATRLLSRIFQISLTPLPLVGLVLIWLRAVRARAVAEYRNLWQIEVARTSPPPLTPSANPSQMPTTTQLTAVAPLALGIFGFVKRTGVIGSFLVLGGTILCGLLTFSLLAYYSFLNQKLRGRIWSTVWEWHWFRDAVDRGRVAGHGLAYFFLGTFGALITVWIVWQLYRWMQRLQGSAPRSLFTEEDDRDKSEGVPALAIALAFVLVVASGVGLGFWACKNCGHDLQGRPAQIERFSLWLAWPLFIVMSWVARSFLIQYMGDVAAYVSPHALDRFNELRAKIRLQVRSALEGVYAAQEGGSFTYDEVFVVGHSLGSVIAYDSLNRLLAEDELMLRQGSGKGPLAVLDRTRLLLTFGSPLDKIAFIFALQGKKTSETREALAAQVQPLIREKNFRANLDWVNLYSPYDIIGGHLDLYGRGDAEPGVGNEKDPFATTPLVAHIEFWDSPILYERLLRYV